MPQLSAVRAHPQRLDALKAEQEAAQELYRQAHRGSSSLRRELQQLQRRLQEKQDTLQSIQESIEELRTQLQEASHVSQRFAVVLSGALVCLGMALKSAEVALTADRKRRLLWVRRSGRSCKTLKLQTWLLDWQGRCVAWPAADHPPAQAAREEQCSSRGCCCRADGAIVAASRS